VASVFCSPRVRLYVAIRIARPHRSVHSAPPSAGRPVITPTADSAVVTGRVWNAFTGMPLAGAVLQLQPLGGGSVSAVGANSGSNGQFALRYAAHASAAVRLVVIALGFQPRVDTLPHLGVRGQHIDVYLAYQQRCLEPVTSGNAASANESLQPRGDREHPPIH
jgi:hypothetical protein